jgi:hypothetical protein
MIYNPPTGAAGAAAAEEALKACDGARGQKAFTVEITDNLGEPISEVRLRKQSGARRP